MRATSSQSRGRGSSSTVIFPNDPRRRLEVHVARRRCATPAIDDCDRGSVDLACARLPHRRADRAGGKGQRQSRSSSWGFGGRAAARRATGSAARSTSSRAAVSSACASHSIRRRPPMRARNSPVSGDLSSDSRRRSRRKAGDPGNGGRLSGVNGVVTSVRLRFQLGRDALADPCRARFRARAAPCDRSPRSSSIAHSPSRGSAARGCPGLVPPAGSAALGAPFATSVRAAAMRRRAVRLLQAGPVARSSRSGPEAAVALRATDEKQRHDGHEQPQGRTTW